MHIVIGQGEGPLEYDGAFERVLEPLRRVVGQAQLAQVDIPVDRILGGVAPWNARVRELASTGVDVLVDSLVGLLPGIATRVEHTDSDMPGHSGAVLSSTCDSVRVDEALGLLADAVSRIVAWAEAEQLAQRADKRQARRRRKQAADEAAGEEQRARAAEKAARQKLCERVARLVLARRAATFTLDQNVLVTPEGDLFAITGRAVEADETEYAETRKLVALLESAAVPVFRVLEGARPGQPPGRSGGMPHPPPRGWEQPGSRLAAASPDVHPEEVRRRFESAPQHLRVVIRNSLGIRRV